MSTDDINRIKRAAVVRSRPKVGCILRFNEKLIGAGIKT